MFFFEIFEKIKFWMHADRIGIDMPNTHWQLYFKSTMRRLCLKKFKDFGSDAEVRPGACIVGCSKISIGKRVVIRPFSVIEADPREKECGIKIEDDVLLGPGVHIYVSDHSYKSRLPIIDQGYSKSKEVVIKKGAWIGADAIILKGVTIGYNSVVGAGSVVTKSVPDRSIVAGNPAKVIKKLGQ
jgi:acetyltransferase-like isoleucine patch superfamily enzyme